MSVTITKPASGAELKGSVTVEATYSGTGFDTASVTLDGTQLGSDSSQPISVAIDTTRIPDGGHTLTVAVRYRAKGGRLRWQKASILVTVKNGVAPPPPPPPPAKPSIPTGLVATPGDGKVTLKWNANPASEGVNQYQLYEADDPDGGYLFTAGLTFDVTKDHLGAALVNGRAYSFRASARNAAGIGAWTTAVSATPAGVTPPPPPPPPPPGNRYTDVNFSAGKYDGEGISEIFECSTSEPRLDQSWGGRESSIYDSYGLTTDQNQRVHLSHAVPPPRGGSTWVSWQELRTTDGPWGQFATNLAKASINMHEAETWGGSFSFGMERWFAFDIYFPLNVNGVSYEFSNSFNTLGDIHSTAGNADNLTRVFPNGNSHPKYLTHSVTANWATTAYYNTNLVQLSDSSGNRITSNFNVWHEVVWGTKPACDGSVGSSSGWVEVWCNGVQKLPRLAMPTYECSEGSPYFQLQNYTQYPNSYLSGATRSAIVYGGFRAGMTRADVQTR